LSRPDGGKDQALRIQIMENREIPLAPRASHLIDSDRAHLGMLVRKPDERVSS